MDIKIRNLKACDIKPFVRIIKKLGIFTLLKQIFFNSTEDIDKYQGLSKDEVKEKIIEDSKKDTLESVINKFKVLDIAELLIENYEEIENELFTFLSGLSGKTKEEIADLDLDILIDLIMQIRKDKSFSNFFKSASKPTAQNSQTDSLNDTQEI